MDSKAWVMVMCCAFSFSLSAMEHVHNESYQRDSTAEIAELANFPEGSAYSFVDTQAASLERVLGRLDLPYQQDIRMRVGVLKLLAPEQSSATIRRRHEDAHVDELRSLLDESDAPYYMTILIDDLKATQESKKVAEDNSDKSDRRAVAANRIAMCAVVVAIAGVITPIVMAAAHCS